MNEASLKRVEGGLAIILPAEFRAFMLARGAELRQINEETRGKLRQFIEATANELLILNCYERMPGSGTSDAVPQWWKEYLLIGTDGGGGFYGVCLDGRPGVWMIGSDCGEPEKKFDTLTEYVEHFIQYARAQKQ